ncbi:MAG TPA: hypothetical protein VEA99_09610, partial [Gemmatimonadaceae bacterium]|nr:hypothetical protein [Gemmatimonadaceae bacterium]
MPRTRRPLVALLVAVTAVATGFVLTRTPFDQGAWLADYAALRTAMERDYANLAALAPRVDLPALHARTDSALRAARSDREARAALQRFVTSFEDGHFHLQRPAPAFVRKAEERWNAWRTSTPSRDWSAAEACDAFGYRERDGDFSLPLDAVGRATPLVREGSFRTAMVTLADGRRIGVVRIPLLSQRAYRVECEAAWTSIRDSVGAGCADCEERLYDATADRLLVTLGARLRALRDAGAAALLVDLGRNGGGSEWAEDVVRVLTTRPVHSAPTALVRGPAAASIYEGEIARLDALLADSTRPPRARAAIDSARHRYRTLRDEARRPCDLSALWRRGAAAPACGNVLPAV